jgi:hypothetical protein
MAAMGCCCAWLIICVETSNCRSELAPGGVPTMVVNDYACCLNKRGACRFFASKLAPTVGLADYLCGDI